MPLTGLIWDVAPCTLVASMCVQHPRSAELEYDSVQTQMPGFRESHVPISSPRPLLLIRTIHSYVPRYLLADPPDSTNAATRPISGLLARYGSRKHRRACVPRHLLQRWGPVCSACSPLILILWFVHRLHRTLRFHSTSTLHLPMPTNAQTHTFTHTNVHSLSPLLAAVDSGHFSRGRAAHTRARRLCD